MRQPTTAEVRLDEHKAASFGPAAPSILPFWLPTSRLRSNFVAAEPPGTKIATNNFGIREMSAQRYDYSKALVVLECLEGCRFFDCLHLLIDPASAGAVEKGGMGFVIEGVENPIHPRGGR